MSSGCRWEVLRGAARTQHWGSLHLTNIASAQGMIMKKGPTQAGHRETLREPLLGFGELPCNTAPSDPHGGTEQWRHPEYHPGASLWWWGMCKVWAEHVSAPHHSDGCVWAALRRAQPADLPAPTWSSLLPPGCAPFPSSPAEQQQCWPPPCLHFGKKGKFIENLPNKGKITPQVPY